MYAFNAFAALTVVLGLLANNVAGAALPSPEDYSEYRLCIGGAIKCDFNNGQHCYNICTGNCVCPSVQPGGSAGLTTSACAFGPTAANRAQCS